MQRGKKLIILLAILLIAVGGYLVVSKLANKEDDADKAITAFSIDKTNITRISWTYSGENITLMYDRSNEKWLYTEDESFPVNETFMQSMLSALASITADRKLTDVTDFSEYGLDNPNCTITITDSNGGSTKFTIGNQNTGTSGYYFRINDENNIYLIGSTLPGAFFHQLYDIVSMEEIPYIDNMNQIAVGTSGKTNTIVMLDQDERAKYSYTSSYAWYYKQSDSSYKAIDGDMAENVIAAVSDLAWSSCVDYKATDDKLQSYGLKNPFAKVTVNYTVKSSSDSTAKETPAAFSLLIGNKTGDSYYAKLPDSGMVYLIPSATVDTFVNTGYASLKPREVCLMDWSTVDSMDVTINSKTSTIAFSRTQSSSDSTATTTTYTVNGNEADSDSVEAFLSGINNLTSESTTDKGTYSEKGDIVMVFHRNTDSNKTMTLSFTQYDSKTYLVSFNGEARQLINKSDTASLESSFNSIK